eukprot:CAMPEP_0172613166 /NCGR_PEP_ID=MMETSP1068-20121228/40514_1 /TAXON_ID=35684 /ORGANISM="Pseudopedinella elastica, Strain CCMP716" /LENGTH=89 /DNA_ID=CAMNT_0013417543 /DNA_START=16 /DNA_END=282 /DNA_ORIENTATION=+
MKVATKEQLEYAESESLASANAGPESINLEPSGLLRVLVTDDQRTMRQMVSMLFQNFCHDYPAMKVEITTALSGEEACRLVAQGHTFHI